eukprot:253759_1
MEHASISIMHAHKIKIYSIIHIVIGFIFWIYALINVIFRGYPFDGGVTVFLLPIIGGIFGMLSLKSDVSRKKYQSRYASLHFWFIVIGDGLCTISYVGGAVIATQVDQSDVFVYTYVIYCSIFAVVWLIGCICCGKLAWQWKQTNKTESDYKLSAKNNDTHQIATSNSNIISNDDSQQIDI